jgi:hypothetical protein
MSEKELETLNEYDNDTGAPLASSEKRATNEEAELLLARAEALSQMKITPGWQVVNEFIDTQIASHTSKLITENDFKEVRRLQEYLKALANIQSFVDVTISEASQFAELVAQQSQDPD